MFIVIWSIVFAAGIVLTQWLTTKIAVEKMLDDITPDIAATIATVVGNVREDMEKDFQYKLDMLKASQHGAKDMLMSEVDTLFEQFDDLHEYLGLEYVDEGEKLVKRSKK